jgi:hypothetical protein
MQPGFWDITGRKHNFCPSGYTCSHRQVLQQSRQVFHVAPWGASLRKYM